MIVGIFNCTMIGHQLEETNITIEIYSNNDVKIYATLTTLCNNSETTIQFRQFDSKCDMKKKLIDYLNDIKSNSIMGINMPVDMHFIEDVCSMTALQFGTLMDQKKIQLTNELHKLDDFIEELSE